MRLAKRTRVTILLILCVLTCGLVLAGLPIGRAATTSHATSEKTQDSSRQAALQELFAQFKSGAPFSEEEGIILRKFGEGITLTDLEADVVISRALFDHYILSKEITKDQQELLDRYSLSVARRSTDVADLKTQLLNKRIAAAAAAPPRTTPLLAPSNDLCGGAEVIPPAGPFPYLTAVTADITDATTAGDPPVPSCQNNISRSIWYTFTPSTTARYTISTCTFDGTSTTVTDPVMAIYTSAGGCGGAFTEIPTAGPSDGCDDDFCVTGSLQAVITTQLTGGTQYYIVVWQFDTPPPAAGQTAVQLRVSQVLPPVNDTCAGAAAITLDAPVNGTTAVAANDYQLSGAACFTGVGQTQSTAPGGDVVYSFTAPAAGNYSFKVTNFDTSHNLILYLASTCPAGAPPVTVGTCLAAANRQSASASEEVNCVALSSGQQVFAIVDENVPTAGSSFTIEVNLCVRETEPNNTPATANTLTCGIEGSINPGTDADFYSVGTPAAGSRLFAMIDGVAGNSTDFDLRVTTSTDTLEYDDSNNDPPFGSLAPNVAGTPLTGAASFIRVDQHGAVAAEPYRLYAVVQPPSASATAETEGNNTIGTANSAANNYFSGSLAGPAPSTDIDHFVFTANAGDLIFLSLDCDPLRDATPVNAALALLDSAGTELLSVNDFQSTSSTTTGAGSLTAVTPNSPAEGLVWRARTSGVYYAKVFIGTSSTGSTGTGDYLLSISRNCAAGMPPQYQGSHDGAGCNTISGWAWDQNDPSSTVSVDIYDGNAFIATIPANMYREDLLNAIGSPSHGFSYSTPAALQDGAVHFINVKFSGTNTLLPNSTRPIQCTSAAILQGRHDGQGCDAIEGWAWDSHDPFGTVNVDIYDGANLIGTVAATLYRQDLADVFGSPYHGFIFHPPASLKDGQPHVITVKFGGTNTNLTWDTPRTFTCSGSTPDFQGNHDIADCNTISGYAWDVNDDQGTLIVAIYADGNLLVVVPAQQAYPGIGNGFHGFVFAVPAGLKDGQPHSMLVRFSGTTTALSNSPRNINCP